MHMPDKACVFINTWNTPLSHPATQRTTYIPSPRHRRRAHRNHVAPHTYECLPQVQAVAPALIRGHGKLRVLPEHAASISNVLGKLSVDYVAVTRAKLLNPRKSSTTPAITLGFRHCSKATFQVQRESQHQLAEEAVPIGIGKHREQQLLQGNTP